QVDVDGDVEDAGYAAQPVDLLPVGVDRIDGRAGVLGPAPDLPGHDSVGAARRVGCAHHGDAPGVEERVEVDRAQLDRAPGHVEADGCRMSGGPGHAIADYHVSFGREEARRWRPGRR